MSSSLNHEGQHRRKHTKIESWPTRSQHQPLDIESGLSGDNTGWASYMKTSRAFFEVIKAREPLKICVERILLKTCHSCKDLQNICYKDQYYLIIFLSFLGCLHHLLFFRDTVP